MREATWIGARLEALKEQFDELMSSRDGSFGELEQDALELANVLVRSWARDKLQRMALRYGDEVRVDGQRYRRHATGRKRYHSLSGSIEIERETYRLVGVHNGPTVVPVELEAGIVENATPALVRSVLHGFAMMPLRHYEEEMRAAHRIVPSRTTLERISKRVGTSVHEQLAIIEPVIRASEAIPNDVASVSVGVDRTTMPMAEQQQALPDYWYRHRTRRPPAPIVVAYRMAYITTVALHDATGATLRSVRIAATAGEGPVEMMERLGAELTRILAQRPSLPIVVVQDGAPELWNLVEEWLPNFGITVTMKIVDRYHVEERLAQIAELLERDERARRRLRDEWRRKLERSDRAIKKICSYIESRIFETVRVDGTGWEIFGGDHPEFVVSPRGSVFQTEAVQQHVRYCKNQSDKMHYASAIKNGFPIGSGVTEGACKSVIGARFKRSGQRWLEAGASPCLQLRTLVLNNRFEQTLFAHGELSRRGIEIN